MRRIAISILAAISLSACAHDVSRETPTVAANDPSLSALVEVGYDGKACDADVLVYDSETDSYACGEFKPTAIHHKTVFSNNYHAATRLEEYSSFNQCAAAYTPDIQAIQDPESKDFYVVDAIWCIQRKN